MLISQLFPSKFLKAADLQGKRVTVTIDRLVLEKIGPEREEKPLLIFQRASKSMILNRTNAMAIVSLHGDDAAKWGGKRIVLFATQVRAFGQNHDVVRVAAEIPPSPAPATQPATTPPVEEAGIDDLEDLVDDSDLRAEIAAGAGDNPFDDALPAAEVGVRTGTELERLRKEMHALGSQLYGAAQWDAVRHKSIRRLTANRTEHTADLTPDELRKLVAGMRKLQVNRAIQLQSANAGVPRGVPVTA